MGFEVLPRIAMLPTPFMASVIARSTCGTFRPQTSFDCLVVSVIMSFCFNFDLPAQTTTHDEKDGNKQQNGKEDNDAECVSNSRLSRSSYFALTLVFLGYTS